ncbi:ATP-binding protein [Streptacidiphilus sp. N1-3]|uniref:histidine kinase n=1 Tax=Streptacidiphilus alkalitolerans TaxID=3342712 RepID=A0ABV6WXX9_9ACTN
MSVQLPPLTRIVLLPLAAAAAVGGVTAWAALRTSGADRNALIGLGAAAAVLLYATLALAAARTRANRAAKLRAEAIRAEAGEALARQAEAVRQAGTEAEASRRAAWDAETLRQAAAESEALLRSALDVEAARSAALQAEIRQLEAELDQYESQAEQLALQIVPQAVKSLRHGGSAATVLAQAPAGLAGAHLTVLRTLVQEVGSSERMRASAMAACANAAGRVQALATGMLADLREMENRHGEEVLGDLLQLDHGTAQAGRLADSIAVLTGARSGRRWTKPIVMESVLRGAMGRISAYQRIRLHSASTVSIAGYAAEGVMHALAELMDNATTFSPPTEEVHVYVQEMHSGVVVTIEDGGLVMPAATLARAEQLVSAEPLDLMTLSGTRLGLAVVGCLARKHGLTVSFRPSSRGGTGVVVLIPPQLVTRPQERAALPAPEQDPSGGQPVAALPAGGGARRATPGPGAADPAGAAAAGTPERGAAAGSGAAGPGEAEPALAVPGAAGAVAPGELPKRPRGQTLAAAQAARPAPAPEPPPARPDAGARFAAFQAATRTPHGQDTDER